MLAVCQFQHAQRARCADRVAAENSLHEWQRLTIGTDKLRLGRRGRRRFAAVKSFHIATVKVQ